MKKAQKNQMNKSSDFFRVGSGAPRIDGWFNKKNANEEKSWVLLPVFKGEDFKLPPKKVQRTLLMSFRLQNPEVSVFLLVSALQQNGGQVEVQSPVGKPVMDQEVRTTASAKAGKVGTDSLMEQALDSQKLVKHLGFTSLSLVKHDGRNR